MPASLRDLIRLLDDESDVVRKAVRQELERVRKDLPEQMAQLDRPLSEAEDQAMEEMLAPSRREDLEDLWLSWMEHPSPSTQLEQAVSMLSAYLSGWKARPKHLRELLDRLGADASMALSDRLDARTLAQWLFRPQNGEARLSGNKVDYYSPDNSNLLAVLSTGMGNPISLCTIYLLVGRRLGLKVEGCNFPNHFMARVMHEGETWLVDCFNRGRFFRAEEVAQQHPLAAQALEEIIYQPAPVASIVRRFLRNLEDIFEQRSLTDDWRLMRKLVSLTLESEER
jgi:regulator of sirC expression with transglutaminase-like and TPR domain